MSQELVQRAKERIQNKRNAAIQSSIQLSPILAYPLTAASFHTPLFVDNRAVDPFTHSEIIPYKRYDRRLPSQAHETISESLVKDVNRDTLKTRKDQIKRESIRSKSKDHLESRDTIDSIIAKEELEMEESPEYINLQMQLERQLSSTYVGLMKCEQTNNAAFNPLLLFYPKLKCNTDILQQFNQTYNLQDEGFYVQYTSKSLARNLQKLEHRLLIRKDDLNYGWFGTNQQLSITPVPWKPFVYRPANSMTVIEYLSPETRPRNEPSNTISAPAEYSKRVNFKEQPLEVRLNASANILQVVLQKAYTSSKFKLVSPEQGGSFTILFDLRSINIRDHPYMTDEMRLAKECSDMISVLRERQRSKIVDFLTHKLASLKTAHLEFKIRNAASAPAAEPGSQAGIYPVKPDASFYERHGHQNDQNEINQLIAQENKAMLEDIRATRSLRDTEIQTDLVLEFQIIKNWEHIKQLRIAQGFVSAALDIKVRATANFYKEDIDAMELEIQSELSELREYHEVIEMIKRQQYHASLLSEQLSSSVNRKSKSEQITSPSTDMEKEKNDCFNDNLDIPAFEASESLLIETKKLKDRLREASKGSEATLGKPYKSTQKSKEHRKNGYKSKRAREYAEYTRLEFDEVEHIKMLETRIRGTRRIAGAPSLSIMSSLTESVTDAVMCPREEMNRRRCLNETRIYLKIFYNDSLVTQTEPISLDTQNFQVSWKRGGLLDIISQATVPHHDMEAISNVISVNVKEIPESIKAEIYELGILGSELVGECYIKVPGSSEIASVFDKELAELSFTGRSFTPSFVSQIDKDESHIQNRWVCGLLKMNVVWAVDEFGDSLGPKGDIECSSRHNRDAIFSVDPLQRNGLAGALSIKKLMDWVVDARIDPNDPRNQNLHRIKQLVMQTISGTIPRQTFASLGDSWAGENVDQEILKNLPFHIYWKAKKYFRTTLPMGFLAKSVLLACPSTSKIRNELIEARWNNKISPRIPIPLKDTSITQDMFEKIGGDQYDDIKEVMKFATPAYSLPLVSKAHLGQSQSTNARAHIDTPPLRFIKQIRAHQLLKKARESRPKRVQDYVREANLPAADPRKSFFGNFFGIRRPLKPERTDATQKFLTSRDPTPNAACKIMIQVLRGFNVPARSNLKTKFSGASLDDSINPGRKHQVQSYIEVTFQRKRARTNAADGINPCWNETLELPVFPGISDTDAELIQPGGGISLRNMAEGELCSEMIYFNLFDELIYDMGKDDRERGKRIDKRIERNWLGVIALPFSTIHERIKLDGVYSFEMPAVTLGYEKNIKNNGGQIEDAVMIGIDTATRKTLVHLFITLEPPISQPMQAELHFQTAEDDIMLRYAQKWQAMLNARYPHIKERILKTTTLDLDGKTTFVTRFIRSLEPPPGDFGSSVERITRFVSRVPYLASRVLMNADLGLWCTSSQLLEIRAGDGAEHAILLCNLLKGLQKTRVAPQLGLLSLQATDDPRENRHVYVVLGRGLEGSVAYVLLKEQVLVTLKPDVPSKIIGLSDSLQRIIEPKSKKIASAAMATSTMQTSMTLINPVTGETFSAGDPYIPIKEIGCVFDETNVWCNIQKLANPNTILWDFEITQAWSPMITPRSPIKKLESIQSKTLIYKRVSPEYTANLEQLIEKCLVSKIEEWRDHRITRWNRLASRTFAQVLQRFEDDVLGGIDISGAYRKELAPIRSVYNVAGFPLNMAYTDVDAVVEAIYATDVHSCGDPLVEFALAVSCKEYPGGFVSVWVYIANLTR